MLILNAFSKNMVNGSATVRFVPLSIKEARKAFTVTSMATMDSGVSVDSAVGHADTAAVFSSVLGINIPANRKTVTLKPGNAAILGQYTGPRLPEGTTELPEGAKIEWFRVEIIDPDELDTLRAKMDAVISVLKEGNLDSKSVQHLVETIRMDDYGTEKIFGMVWQDGRLVKK